LNVYTASVARAEQWAHAAARWRVLRRAANLDDVFLRLTGRDLRD